MSVTEPGSRPTRAAARAMRSRTAAMLSAIDMGKGKSTTETRRRGGNREIGRSGHREIGNARPNLPADSPLIVADRALPCWEVDHHANHEDFGDAKLLSVSPCLRGRFGFYFPTSNVHPISWRMRA